MFDSNAMILLKHINKLLNLFLVDEKRFPTAKGKMKYNPVDFQTLRFIKENSCCRAIEIAKALSVAPTTQQSSLDRLIKKKLVRREAHPSDQRSKIHSLTESGDGLVNDILNQDIENMNFILNSLSESEQKTLLALFEKVEHKIDAAQ